MGLAARHLWRFGSLTGSLLLSSAGGFGGSVLLLAIDGALGRLGARGPGLLADIALGGMMLFGTALVLVTLGVLLKRLIAPSGDE